MDIRLAKARWELGLSHVEDLPSFAADALEAGFDGPTVRRVAGLIMPTQWDISSLLDRLWSELGAPDLTNEEAVTEVLKETARKIVETPARAREIADTLTPVYYKHFDPVIWAFLEPMDYGVMISLEEQRSQILEVARKYLAGQPLFDKVEISKVQRTRIKTQFKMGQLIQRIKSYFS